jgi:mono/diheme cytochrome c family protein
MIPNRANHIWLQADQPGYFYGQCAQFCGDSHAVMRFRVIALDEKEFAGWLAQQTQPARPWPRRALPPDRPPQPHAASPRSSGINSASAPPMGRTRRRSPAGSWRAQEPPDKDEDPALIARGRALFQAKTCISCHTVRGQEGAGRHRPRPHARRRPHHHRRRPAGEHPEQLARWISHPEPGEARQQDVHHRLPAQPRHPRPDESRRAGRLPPAASSSPLPVSPHFHSHFHSMEATGQNPLHRSRGAGPPSRDSCCGARPPRPA